MQGRCQYKSESILTLYSPQVHQSIAALTWEVAGTLSCHGCHGCHEYFFQHKTLLFQRLVTRDSTCDGGTRGNTPIVITVTLVTSEYSKGLGEIQIKTVCQIVDRFDKTSTRDA